MPTFTVTITGPMFDGRAQAAVRDFLQEATYVVAGQALAEVQLVLDRSIKHPTPYYETQVTSQRLGEDMVVHDRGIVYGPWLEGVSHRNQSTRFKGYAAFRKATQEMEKKAGPIAERVLPRFLGAMD
jgi:hypothetical protein